MEDGRGFTLAHQRVVLDIDFAGVITASAHLTINPSSPSLRTIYLHASPLLQILGVSLSSPTSTDPLLPTPVSYTLSQPFQPLPTREPPIDIRSHTEIKRKTWAAINEKDEGELAISVAGGWVRLIEGEMALCPIEVQIDYRLNLGGDVVEGIVFEQDPPHVYLSPTAYDAARIWTPCVDSLWEQCTWEIEFIVPAYVDDLPVMVVSSGELIEQTTHPHSSHKTIFYYLQTTPTSVQHIAFAVGPFETHLITESPKPILGFCLPGHLDMLVNSTSFLPSALQFYFTEFGSYPFTEFKAVFVANPRSNCTTGATISILSSDLLHPAGIIDQAIVTRQIMSLSLIQQWIGVNIIPRTLSDTWLINGLAIYINGLFLRHLLGNNEYRFRLKKDIERCVRLDQGDQWPICVPGCLDPPDISFINLKAPLVLHILDRHLAKAGTSLGLSRVIPKIFLSALSDELPGNTLSTQFFFKTCRKISGLDLQTFQDQWVFGSGCPHFRFQTNFIRKKFTVELYMNQVTPKGTKRPTTLFEGGLTVRIHEADGAPFEHVVDIKTAQKLYNLPFNTKYKRTRRSGHVAARFRKLQEELEDSEEPSLKAAETFAYPPWDDEEERDRWKVAEWPEDQAEIMMGEGGGYEWIRIDPDCEWLASFDFSEKPWYWISQLQSDRDVVAQLEAVQNMALHLSPVVASELARTILVDNYYYRVRMEAAKALVNYSTAESEYIGLFYLLKIFKTLYCKLDDGDPLDADFIIEPNDFSDYPRYFLKKTIITALSDLRDPTNRTSWRMVRKLLLNILHSVDNTSGKGGISDANYLATVVSAIGNAFVAAEREDQDQILLREAIEAVQRAITMDRLVPSYQNLVTQSGLLALLKLTLAGQRVNDSRLFLGYTREGNFEPLRLLAFDCILLSRAPGRSIPLLAYLASVIRNDSSLVVRRHVARALSEAILVSLAMGDVAGVNVPAIVDVTNDTEHAREKRSEDHNASIVKSLRKEFGKKQELREAIQAELLTSFTGYDDVIRFALIKVAEISTSSTQEPLPGNLITLQTPTVETPVLQTPKIRINMGSSTSATPRNETDGYGFPAVEPPQPLLKLKLNPAAPAKKKHVHKSQTKGLSDIDRAAILNALKKLVAHKTSYLFRQPVDPVRDGAPDYLTIIKQPMDLSTAQAKLDNGLYATRQEFADDMRLIVRNCMTYNAAGTPVFKVAESFQSYFNTLWTRTEATLVSSSQGPSQPEPPIIARPSEPQSAPALTIKTKIKPPKSVTIDTKPVQLVPPMAPPPVPPSRKPSITLSTAGLGEPSKKRKESSKSALDDMLGAEVDAMEQTPQVDYYSDILEPKPKKIKLPIMPKSTPAKGEKESGYDTYLLDPQPNKSKPPNNRRSSPEKVVSQAQTPLQPSEVKLQVKKPKPRPVDVPAPAPLPPPPAPILAAAPLVPYVLPRPPADLPPTTSHTMTFRQRRSRALVSIISKSPDAIIFLRPVDPVLDGCPSYLDEIKEPMDLGTIAQKIEQKKYKTMGQLAYDIELVWKNCRQFNTPGDAITALADASEAIYWREWPKAVSPRMTPSEKKEMSALLSKALKDNISAFFREAVDPVLLQIPHYFQIIPREDARDLSLIKKKVDSGSLTTPRQVDEDVQLMLDNARVFNEEGIVVDAANDFERWWNAQRAKME